MSYRTIKDAQRAVWPRVQQSLELRRAAREAVNADRSAATTAAKTRARIPWNKVVMEETVWAITKEGLLATPEQAAVVKAAREWARYWSACDLDQLDDDERRLYAAVQGLASSLAEVSDVEVLTDQEIARSVPLSSTNH